MPSPSSLHLHNRLRWQLSLYFVLALIFCGVSAYHTITENIRLSFALGGFLCGGLIGIIFSRMQHISWDHGARQVIGRFDALGFALLALYVIFEILRTRIVSLFVQGPSVLITSFAVLAGVMFGRVLGIRGKIREVLKEQDLID